MCIRDSPSALLVGMQTGAATVENSMEGPQKIKSGTAFWPRESASVYKSKEKNKINVREYMHPYIHCSVIYISQGMEATKVPINRQVDKQVVVHTYSIRQREVYSCLDGKIIE